MKYYHSKGTEDDKELNYDVLKRLKISIKDPVSFIVNYNYEYGAGIHADEMIGALNKDWNIIQCDQFTRYEWGIIYEA